MARSGGSGGVGPLPGRVDRIARAPRALPAAASATIVLALLAGGAVYATGRSAVAGGRGSTLSLPLTVVALDTPPRPAPRPSSARPTTAAPRTSTPAVAPRTSVSPAARAPQAVVAAPGPRAVALAPGDSAAEARVFALINSERASVNLPPLAWSNALALAAHQHNNRMDSANLLSHGSAPSPAASACAKPAPASRGRRARRTSARIPARIRRVPPSSRRSCSTSRPAPTAATSHDTLVSTVYNAVGVSVIIDPRTGTLWLDEEFSRG